MRLPVKLSDSFWPSWLYRFIGANLRKDPRILVSGKAGADPDARSKAISCFKFGTTFKTTGYRRHRLSDELVTPYFREEMTVLDIGASDGITSLDLMEKVGFRFRRYFVSDYNLEVRYLWSGARCFFFSPEGACILIAGPLFVSYPGESGFVRRLHRRTLQRLQPQLAQAPSLQLIHPRLADLARQDDRIRILRYNVFEPWKDEQPQLIKIANVLNFNYFSTAEIEGALKNLLQTLPDSGLLLIVENRPGEQAALYRKNNGRFELLEKIGPGVDIHQLVIG
ncbi:MAG: hypothetical protein KDC32_05180 [Saprospiraceae bacterium]|nr:hypothetical protein [Saprospiraceae bacterium]MCB0680326.1 hypothetical protein [Saprospiraceae bacterium]